MNIALIGFGEAGRIYAQDLAQQGVRVIVWDKKFLTPDAASQFSFAGLGW